MSRTTCPHGMVDTCCENYNNCNLGRQAIAEAEKQEPVALEPIYYMRDNHTFKRLSDDVSKALVEIEQEFNEGWTYGSLCSKREKFPMIHASGSAKRLEFFDACNVALEAAHGIKG